jgi:hypothetical protein
MPLHHHLEVCIKEEQVYLGEGCWSWLGCGAGLGWVVATTFFVISPELHYICFNYYVMAKNYLSLRN